MNRPLRYAHRGLRTQAAENTLAAFSVALTSGFDGIETDVRASRDGEAVLYHDRLAPDGTPVACLTRRELCQITGLAIPTLAEALCHFPKAYWDIELKSTNCLQCATAVIDQHPWQNQIMLSSFHHHLMAQAAQKNNRYCSLIIANNLFCEHTQYQYLTNIQTTGVRGLVWDYEILDEQLLQTCATSGLAQYIYGIGNPDEYRRCLSLPVAGIICDQPEWVADS